MRNRREGWKRIATIVGLGGVIAVLAPVGVMAAGSLVAIGDGKGPSQAQVKSGKLQVGGAVTGTVDVDVPGRGASLLAQGECNTDADGYPDNGVVASGKTVVGVVLTGDHGTSSINTLTVAAPSSANTGNRLYTLMTGQTTGYADFNAQLDFGPGIQLAENWTLSCTGQPGASQGNGLWFVYGY